jgi:SWI/SNF related-matrix-associated actin-dependent regulator of chromatin subfamily C
MSERFHGRTYFGLPFATKVTGTLVICFPIHKSASGKRLQRVRQPNIFLWFEVTSSLSVVLSKPWMENGGGTNPHGAIHSRVRNDWLGPMIDERRGASWQNRLLPSATAVLEAVFQTVDDLHGVLMSPPRKRRSGVTIRLKENGSDVGDNAKTTTVALDGVRTRRETATRNKSDASRTDQKTSTNARPKRVKSCHISLKEYEDPHQIAKFEAISVQLNAEQPEQLGFRPGDSVDVSPRALSLLTANLLQFQERVLGQNSVEPPEIRGLLTKLPHRLFQDYSSQGSLRTILECCFRFRVARGIRRFDLHKPDMTRAFLDMLVEVQGELIKRGQLRMPSFFFAPALPSEEVGRLTTIAKKHGASVVSSPLEASHIVYPDPPGTTEIETESEDYCVSLRRKGNQILTHWWYFPDSYDSWIPAQEVEDPDGELHGDEENLSGVIEGKKWHVQKRFLEDVEKFNEWGNENDYETIPDEDKLNLSEWEPGVVTNNDDAAPKDSSASASQTPSKRKAVEATPSKPDLDGIPERLSIRPAQEENSEPMKIKLRLAPPMPENDAASSSNAMGKATGMPVPGPITFTADAGGAGELERPPVEANSTMRISRPTMRPLVPDDTALRMRNVTVSSRDEQLERRLAQEREALRQRRKERNDAAAAEEDTLPGPSEQAARDRESLAPRRVAEALGGIGADGGVETERLPAAAAAVAVAEKPPIRIPAYSRWFRIDAIHEIERRALPEFFSGSYASKTPEIYMQYRNFMIDTWRQDPTSYLTGTAVRRHLAGDVGAIMRVHAFLEQWGLINYGVLPETRPQTVSGGLAASGATLITSSSGSLAASSSGLEGGLPRILLFDDGSRVPKSRMHLAPMATRRELYAAAAAIEYQCDVCGKDCSQRRFHCQVKADMDLCPDCFHQGRFPEEFSGNDFIELAPVLSLGSAAGATGPVNAPSSDDWTDLEVLQLLEGIEMYGEDWDAVAQHVGTRSRDACIIKFIRLPIEDPFLEDDLSRLVAPSLPSESAGTEKSKTPLFADAGNPLMAQIAFLATSVSPDVAAAAARAALATIMKSDATPEALSDANAIQAVAATALGAAATRASALAAAENAEIHRATEQAIELQLKKLEEKMKVFEQLQHDVIRERERVEIYRKELFAERLNLVARREALTNMGSLATTTAATGVSVPEWVLSREDRSTR